MLEGKNSVIAQMLSEGRRFGVNLVVATQSLERSSASKIQQRFFQCGLLIYFKPPEDKIGIIADLIDKAEKSKWILKLVDLKIGQFIAKGHFMVNGKVFSEPLMISAYQNSSKLADSKGKEKGGADS